MSLTNCRHSDIRLSEQQRRALDLIRKMEREYVELYELGVSRTTVHSLFRRGLVKIELRLDRNNVQHRIYHACT